TVGYLVSLVPTTMGLPLFTTTFDTLMPVSAACAGCAVNAPRASAPESAATRADLPVRMHVLFMHGTPAIGTRIAAGSQPGPARPFGPPTDRCAGGRARRWRFSARGRRIGETLWVRCFVEASSLRCEALTRDR